MLRRYCNMEKVVEFLVSLEGDMRSIAAKSDGDFDTLPLALAFVDVLGKVQARKKTVLSYLSHKIVMFDLYEPLVDKLYDADPSQRNPTASPFVVAPLLQECVRIEVVDVA